jgi:hypothetical protein
MEILIAALLICCPLWIITTQLHEIIKFLRKWWIYQK